MADRVTEIQHSAQAALLGILFDNIFFYHQRAAYDLDYIAANVFTLCDKLKQLLVARRRHFYRLGKPRMELTVVKGGQHVRVDNDLLWLIKCADGILDLAEVNRGLAAYRGIDL